MSIGIRSIEERPDADGDLLIDLTCDREYIYLDRQDLEKIALAFGYALVPLG